jgi:hypothetical protein
MQFATNPESLWLKCRPSRSGAKFGRLEIDAAGTSQFGLVTEVVEKVNSSRVVRAFGMGREWGQISTFNISLKSFLSFASYASRVR